MMRQRADEGGFEGRVNKPAADTWYFLVPLYDSYTFWIGASLGILGARDLVDVDAIKAFLSRAHHDNIGGYGKFEGCVPDLLHSYMSLAGLDLLTREGGIVCELNVRRAHVDAMMKERRVKQ
jgi:prenyltransferase beta subunit